MLWLLPGKEKIVRKAQAQLLLPGIHMDQILISQTLSKLLVSPFIAHHSEMVSVGKPDRISLLFFVHRGTLAQEQTVPIYQGRSGGEHHLTAMYYTEKITLLFHR